MKLPDIFQKLMENILDRLTKAMGGTLENAWFIVFHKFDLYCDKVRLRDRNDLEEYRKWLALNVPDIAEPLTEPEMADKTVNLNPEQEGQDYQRKVRETLLLLGVSPCYRGYWYLYEAILCLLEEDEKNNNDGGHPGGGGGKSLHRDIYPLLAERHGTVPCTIERYMRSTIHIFWSHNGQEILREKFGVILCTIPMNRQFVELLANQM